MGQDPLPRWPRPPHRCSLRGPLWPRTGDTIAPPSTRCPLAPRGSIPLPTGWLHPEGAAGGAVQGAFPPGGTVGVTALCSETLGVHDGDGSKTCPLLSDSPSRALACVGPVAVLVGIQPQPVRAPEPCGTRCADHSAIADSSALHFPSKCTRRQ